MDSVEKNRTAIAAYLDTSGYFREHGAGDASEVSLSSVPGVASSFFCSALLEVYAFDGE